MSYVIRTATREDMHYAYQLIQELADFEKESEAVEISVAQLQSDGFGTQPLFHCFVAEHHAKIIGIALVYPRYSTWKGPVLHLEDLIVNQDYRGQGIGGKLLDEVVKYGQHLGVKRISWEVLDWNEPAIEFYENRGAMVRRDWDVVQLDEQGIANYIARIES